jgi:hypothetical protein
MKTFAMFVAILASATFVADAAAQREPRDLSGRARRRSAARR